MINLPNTKTSHIGDFFNGMKHTLRDTIIFLIDIFGISFLYRTYIRTSGPLVRVVVFHDVADATWFESIVKMLVENYHVLSPAQFHAQEFDAHKINILLTFDDGYQSWIDYCLPTLTQYNVHGLFFINSGPLDMTPNSDAVSTYVRERLKLSPKTLLTWHGVHALIARGHTIGGHSVTHPNLASLTGTVLSKEIVEDKKRIEAELGIQLTDFAYPFGRNEHFNEEVTRSVSEAGYTFVYTANSGFIKKEHTQDIPRVCLLKNQSLSSVQRWIRGGYDIFSTLATR